MLIKVIPTKAVQTSKPMTLLRNAGTKRKPVPAIKPA